MKKKKITIKFGKKKGFPEEADNESTLNMPIEGLNSWINAKKGKKLNALHFIGFKMLPLLKTLLLACALLKVDVL